MPLRDLTKRLRNRLASADVHVAMDFQTEKIRVIARDRWFNFKANQFVTASGLMMAPAVVTEMIARAIFEWDDGRRS